MQDAIELQFFLNILGFKAYQKFIEIIIRKLIHQPLTLKDIEILRVPLLSRSFCVIFVNILLVFVMNIQIN